MSALNLDELGKVLLSLPTNGATIEIHQEQGELFVSIKDCNVEALDALIRYYYIKEVDNADE